MIPSSEELLSASGDWITIARIVRPQGRHGEVLAELLTDFPERFAERRNLWLLPSKGPLKEVELEKHWLHQGRVVLKLAGIDSITDAETLRGLEVVIPRQERAPLEKDAVYIDDLVGCVLHDLRSGEDVGKIIEVDRESTSTPLLVVDGGTCGEVLVPFVKAFRPRIDLDARRMELELPDGLLELNSPEDRASTRKRD